MEPPPIFDLIQEGEEPQRTVRNSTVVYGLGLHSGTRTGMVLQPLPVDSGIHFLTLPKGTLIPAYAAEVADTDYATTISRDGEGIKTVEHLLSALHASGSIPFVLTGERDIPGAPPGQYWDGGIIDYHFDLAAFKVKLTRPQTLALSHVVNSHFERNPPLVKISDTFVLEDALTNLRINK